MLSKFIIFFIMIFFGCFKAHEHKEIEIYYCPMHPQIISNKPGTCPICNMKLVKRSEISKESNATKQENKIQISKEKQNWIGVQTTKSTKRKLRKTLRLAGNIAYETEIFTALSEYKESLKQRSNPELTHTMDLSSVSYNRLLQLGLTREGIQFLLPRANELITGGKSSAIVIARVYEGEVKNIKLNSSVKIFSSSHPEIIFLGKIKAMDGILDSETRTLRAWILAENPNNVLKPQMIVEIEIELDSKEVLTIPSSSIIHVGKKSIVYKKISETDFIPQEILLGINSEDYTEVLEGLGENDEIVTHGNFLIDSETKIRSGN